MREAQPLAAASNSDITTILRAKLRMISGLLPLKMR